MARGLSAQLTAKEDTALRTIAAGSDAAHLPRDHLKHLEAMWLIVSRDGKWELTEFGRTKVTAEPN